MELSIQRDNLLRGLQKCQSVAELAHYDCREALNSAKKNFNKAVKSHEKAMVEDIAAYQQKNLNRNFESENPDFLSAMLGAVNEYAEKSQQMKSSQADLQQMRVDIQEKYNSCTERANIEQKICASPCL